MKKCISLFVVLVLLTGMVPAASAAGNPFYDVAEGIWYYDAVNWAVEKGVTTGTGIRTFSPDAVCTRAQVVTFLWRSEGCPNPKNWVHPFTDVSYADYFNTAVLWAVEQGITNGLSADTFGANEPCTRAQVATFLWRTRKQPQVANRVTSFSDVLAGEYYYDAVLWAVETGVTKGLSDTAFGPDAPCSRGQIVTFLYRASSDYDGDIPTVNLAGVKVSVFWYHEGDVYLSRVRDALNDALDKSGAKYDNQFANGDQARQLEQIRTAVARGANLLVVNIVNCDNPAIAQTVIDAARGIPVIFFNRSLGAYGSDVTLLNYNANACFIGHDAPEAGRVQGKMVGEYVLSNYEAIDLNGDGVISYAMFKGQEGLIDADYRTRLSVEGADAILTAAGLHPLVYFDATNPNKYQVDPEGAWFTKFGWECMGNNLRTYNEDNGNMIELVICNNDGMADGVIMALKMYGYNGGSAHTVPVFGIDCTDLAKMLIADGEMTGTVVQDYKGLAAAIAQTAQGIVSGMTPANAIAALSDPRFTVASDCASKLYVAWYPYTGE